MTLEVCLLLVGEDKWSDTRVRTNESTLVALYAVVGIPLRYEGCYATFLVGCCALIPLTVFDALVCAYGE